MARLDCDPAPTSTPTTYRLSWSVAHTGEPLWPFSASADRRNIEFLLTQSAAVCLDRVSVASTWAEPVEARPLKHHICLFLDSGYPMVRTSPPIKAALTAVGGSSSGQKPNG